jgi:hypothetical protein
MVHYIARICAAAVRRVGLEFAFLSDLFENSRMGEMGRQPGLNSLSGNSNANIAAMR